MSVAARYRVIVADPPYAFATRSEKGQGRLRGRHRAAMSVEDIARLPVGQVAALDSLLLLWATGPLLPQAMAIMAAWGFDYKTLGFIWTPRTAAGGVRMGLGYYTRQGGQVCLLGTRGSPQRAGRDVLQVLDDPVPEDGGKPEEVRDRVERLTPGPYLDLFCDRTRPGWTVLPGWDEAAMGTGQAGADAGWEIVSHVWRAKAGRQVLADEQVHAYSQRAGRARMLTHQMNTAGNGRVWSIRRRIPALAGLMTGGDDVSRDVGEAATVH